MCFYCHQNNRKKMGSSVFLSIIHTITIGTILNFNGGNNGHGLKTLRFWCGFFSWRTQVVPFFGGFLRDLRTILSGVPSIVVINTNEDTSSTEVRFPMLLISQYNELVFCWFLIDTIKYSLVLLGILRLRSCRHHKIPKKGEISTQ